MMDKQWREIGKASEDNIRFTVDASKLINIHANQFTTGHDEGEIRIRFGEQQMLPGFLNPGEEVIHLEEHVSISLSWPIAIRLRNHLIQVIDAYESKRIGTEEV